MKLKGIIFSIIASALTACATGGQYVYLNNFEEQAVDVRISFDLDPYSEESGDISNTDNGKAYIADSLVLKKFEKYFYQVDKNDLSKLSIELLDDQNLKITIPARTSAAILPLAPYWKVNTFTINEKAILEVIDDPYAFRGLYRYKPRITGNSYHLLNIKLEEIKVMLDDEK